MSTLGKLNVLVLQKLEDLPPTSVRDTDGTCDVLTTDLKMEDTSLLIGGNRNLDTVSATLLHLDSVVKPFSFAGPTDAMSI